MTWRKAARGRPVGDNLHADHLDGDGTNNDPANLVPSCQPCNVSAGYRSDRIMPGEPAKTRPNGTKTRAVESVCSQCGAAYLREPSGKPGTCCSRECADRAKRRDVCRRGHPRTGTNLMASGACRECQRLALARYRAKKKAS